MERSDLFKELLKSYVYNGKTLILFSQQYGSQFDNVVPVAEGESLKSYGWREDQSCLKNSVFFNRDNMHPVLASATNELVDVAVDGYFAVYPKNATALLRRRTNGEPTVIAYPYGPNGGHVILTSMYTDWGYAHSQASSAELRIVRDLITWAKNPSMPVPMFNLADNPTPAITLNVKARNNAEFPASTVKIKVYTPDRGQVLYESEQGTTLNPGEEAVIPISFTFPALSGEHYGLCHADYELSDSAGNLVQMAQESDSGRFGVYKVEKTYTPPKGVQMWLTTADENVYWDEMPRLTVNVRNYKEQTLSGELKYDWWHAGERKIADFSLAPGETKSYSFEPVLGEARQYDWAMESLWTTFYYQEFDGSNNTYTAYQRAGKGIEILYPKTKSSISVDGPPVRKLGEPLAYQISTLNQTGKPIAVGKGYNIILSKSCRNREFSLKNPGKDTIIWSCAIHEDQEEAQKQNTNEIGKVRLT